VPVVLVTQLATAAASRSLEGAAKRRGGWLLVLQLDGWQAGEEHPRGAALQVLPRCCCASEHWLLWSRACE
jgi:hypothetical protein